MKVLEFQEDKPVAELRYAAESISSFAANGVAAVGQMAGRLRELIPSIISNFSSSKTVGELPNLKPLSQEQQRFLALLDKASFAEVRQLRADVPEGFCGNFLAYATALADVASQLTNLAAEVLTPYTVFLAQLMGTSNLALLTQDRQHVYVGMTKEREDGEKALGTFFKTGRKEATQRIGEVMARNGDWSPLFEQLRKASDAINAVNRAQLTQLIDQAEDYLGVLHEQLAQGKMAHVTPETSKALAEGAFQVASHIEFYSLVHFRVLVLTEAVKATVERVNKILG